MRSPCTSILSRVVVCGSGPGPEATSAATAPAGTPRARLVSRVAAVRDCGDFAFGTACLRLLMCMDAFGGIVDDARPRPRVRGVRDLVAGLEGGLGVARARRRQQRRGVLQRERDAGRVAECAYSTANENY